MVFVVSKYVMAVRDIVFNVLSFLSFLNRVLSLKR